MGVNVDASRYEPGARPPPGRRRSCAPSPDRADRHAATATAGDRRRRGRRLRPGAPRPAGGVGAGDGTGTRWSAPTQPPGWSRRRPWWSKATTAGSTSPVAGSWAGSLPGPAPRQGGRVGDDGDPRPRAPATREEAPWHEKDSSRDARGREQPVVKEDVRRAPAAARSSTSPSGVARTTTERRRCEAMPTYRPSPGASAPRERPRVFDGSGSHEERRPRSFVASAVSPSVSAA